MPLWQPARRGEEEVWEKRDRRTEEEPCWERGESVTKTDTSVVSILNLQSMPTFFLLLSQCLGWNPWPCTCAYFWYIWTYHKYDFFMYVIIFYIVFKNLYYGILSWWCLKPFYMGKWFLWWNKFIYAINQNSETGLSNVSQGGIKTS